jgi:magnesium chelatase accessory protein
MAAEAFEERHTDRFLSVDGVRWHLQQLGAGPARLLAHGTGASVHSWRDLMPQLAQHFAVTAFDLPGHGDTSGMPRGGLSLNAMSAALGSLIEALGVQPALVAGHSAGAAILCRACLDGRLSPRAVISLNGALLPLHRVQKALFAPVARLLASTPLSSRLFVWSVRDRRAVERLLASSGSSIDAAGIDHYWRLARSRSHVEGALQMMAQWDLDQLERDLPRLKPALMLVVGDNDRMVPPAEAGKVQRLLPAARLVSLPCLGHLAHEERPDLVSELMVDFAARVGAA